MNDRQFDLHMQMLSAILEELQGIRGMMVKDRTPLTEEELKAQHEIYKDQSNRMLRASLDFFKDRALHS